MPLPDMSVTWKDFYYSYRNFYYSYKRWRRISRGGCE